MSVLLIHPPFGALGSPYISIPTLGRYLRARDITVELLDANNEFYRSILAPERIRQAWQRVEAAIEELDGQEQLTFSEMVRFLRLVRAHSEALPLEEAMERAADPTAAMSPGKRMRTLQAAVRLACAPHFPEAVEFLESHHISTYLSPFRKFSSADILRSARRNGLLSGFFQSLLAPVFHRPKRPLIAGISVSFPDQVEAAFRCARVIKMMAPEVHVVLGGAYVSCHMREVKNGAIFDWIDSLVLDDGEIPLEHLYQEWQNRQPDLSRVPGLVYRAGGAVRRNEPASPLATAPLPTPAYDLLPLERYFLPRRNMPLLLRLSRGCPWARCAFCRTELAMVHHHFQPSADYLFEQIRETVTATGSRIFTFTDDSASPEVVEALCERLLQAKLEIRWTVNFRFDPRLTLRRATLFRRAGCHYVTMGLETFNDRLLRLMSKGISTRLIDRVLSNLSWAGLPVTVYMIVGLPTETEQEARKSFEEVEKRRRQGFIADYMYHIFQVARFSDIASHPAKYGIRQLHLADDLDLDPPVFDFEGEGMSRQTARSLAFQFNEAKNGGTRISSHRPGAGRPMELPMRDGTLRLNYDITEAMAVMQPVNDAMGTGSLSEWLSYGEENIKPFRPRSGK